MRTKLLCVFCFWAVSLAAQQNLSALLPYPNRVEPVPGKAFHVPQPATVYCDSPELKFAAASLQRILEKQMGAASELSAGPKAAVRLLIDPSITEKDRYVLEVDRKGVVIKGGTPGAVYYGVMTFKQLLMGDVAATARREIAPVRIDDAPRLPYRALMLDPARHFLPLDDVKFFIDRMSEYKYNVLQLHLTDDQGWRVEIKAYPRLTGIGGARNPHTGPEGPDNGYYTQEQLKELVNYAARRNVEIVPELDIPGHTVAVLAAYPELGCTHTDTIPKIMGKTVDLMLCADKQQVYEMYRTILQEIAGIFPSPYIHLGGDEAVIEKNWTKCSRCRALMEHEGYAKASGLMNYFFGKMLAFVRENGKKPVLWCELNAVRPPADAYLFDYPRDVTLVSWRWGLTPTCIDLAARHGNPMILAPGEYAYLDYPQRKGDFPEFGNWGMPVTSLEQTYRFDPGYGASDSTTVCGVMGTLWGEAIRDIDRVNYMAYPRALALAEAGWTQMQHRGWESFVTRMYPNLTDLMKSGVSVRVPFEIVKRN